MGIQYSGGKWKNLNSKSLSFDWIGPTITGQADLTVYPYIKPIIELQIGTISFSEIDLLIPNVTYS